MHNASRRPPPRWSAPKASNSLCVYRIAVDSINLKTRQQEGEETKKSIGGEGKLGKQRGEVPAQPTAAAPTATAPPSQTPTAAKTAPVRRLASNMHKSVSVLVVLVVVVVVVCHIPYLVLVVLGVCYTPYPESASHFPSAGIVVFFSHFLFFCHVPHQALCHDPHQAFCHAPHQALCHAPHQALCHDPHQAFCHVPHQALCHV